MTETFKYPIVPYEGEWGADIAVNGRPEWLPNKQECSVLAGSWLDIPGCNQARNWNWGVVTKIRLPASHGYYTDNPEYGRVHTDGSRSGGQPAFNLDTWLSETKANLPAIEAAGHSVTFAPDWAEQLLHDLGNNLSGCTRHEINLQQLGIIRSRVRPVL